jgi:hypothetical protein
MELFAASAVEHSAALCILRMPYFIGVFIMSNVKTAIVTLHIDINPDEATKPFGCKIVKAELPAGFEWAASSAMKRHSVLPLKAVKAEKTAVTATKAGPGAVANEANVQALLSQPGLAELLASMMKAQGSAPAATNETPTLAQARKPGRPRKG